MRYMKMDQVLTDTSPAYAEEWLESLPYTDFTRSTSLMIDALGKINEASLKTAARLELLELFLHPYEYLLNIHVKNIENQLSAEACLQRIEPIRRIASELLICCQTAINDSLLRKTRWINTRPPTQAIVIGIRLVSHLLLMQYQRYAPADKQHWRELHDFYLDAGSIEQIESLVSYPVGDAPTKISVELAYKQIIGTLMVDPHHLPFGAIWEIYEQLENWARLIRIEPYKPVENPEGCYLLDLRQGSQPLNLGKYKVKQVNENLRIIDCSALLKPLDEYADSLRTQHKLPEDSRISAVNASTSLEQLRHAYGVAVKRVYPRKDKDGPLLVANGINAVYYQLNERTEFEVSDTDVDEDELIGVDNIFSRQDTTVPRYDTEQWDFVNVSAGGYSILRAGDVTPAVRIGDLIGINNEQGQAGSDWVLGVIRWLMVQADNSCKVGIQNLGVNPRPVALRGTTGNKSETQFRRAFLINQDDGGSMLIAGRGLYSPERSLELRTADDTTSLIAGPLEEATAIYERFFPHA